MNTVYLPHVNREYHAPYKGVALAAPYLSDLDLLGAEWYYVWGPTGYNTPLPYVPMLWDGLPSKEIPGDYGGEILVMNEPNVEAQLNLSPTEACRRLRITREYYPYARLIGPGHSCWAVDWFREFYRLGGRFDAWAIHGYLEGMLGVEHVTRLIRECHDLTGGAYWVTEYGDTRARGDDFARLTAWFAEQPWIERIAAYTNRQPHTGESWEISTNVELVEGGRLTRMGAVYAGANRE